MKPWHVAVLVVGLTFVMVAPLEAQRNCTRGKPCGNTCIAAHLTCRVGTTQPTPPPAPPKPATVAALPAAPRWEADSAWAVSLADSVVFRGTCLAAKDLAPRNRRYFRTEQEALALGFRRSRVIGC